MPRILLILLLLTVLVPSLQAAPPQNERAAVATQVSKMLLAREFDKLDAMAKDFRTSDARTADGFAKLKSFYDGTEAAGADVVSKEGEDAGAKLFDDWRAHSPEEITPLVAAADNKARAAWRARGAATGDKVNQDKWQQFSDRLTEAKAILAEADKMDEFDPHVVAMKMTVGMGLNEDRHTLLQAIYNGMDRYPTYEQMYAGMVLYLLPRWHGDDGDIGKFADEVWDKLPSPLNSMMYARMAGVTYNMERDNYTSAGLNYSRVKAGYEELARQYPDTLSPQKVLFRLAMKERDLETAIAMHNATRGKWTPEEVSAMWPSSAIFEATQLWADGAEVYPGDPTALELAIETGTIDDVTSAIRNGANVNAVHSKGSTMLIRAVIRRRPDVIRELVHAGANVREISKINAHAGGSAVIRNDFVSLDLFFENGMEINAPITRGRNTLLHIAAQRQKPESMAYLLKKPGVNVDARNNINETPLMVAAKEGSAVCVKLLLNAGADPAAKSDDGKTALDRVDRVKHPNLVTMLSLGGN